MFRALRLYKLQVRDQKSPAGLFAVCCSVLGDGMPPCGRAGFGPKKRVVLCTSHSASVLLPDRRRAGRSGGRRATIRVNNGVALYDGTRGPWVISDKA
jgi:hypothetical protein